MKIPSPKRASTFFLKTVLLVIALIVSASCIFSFPDIWINFGKNFPEFFSIIKIGIIGIYATLIPFLFALYQAFILLQNIDNNNAFSASSIHALLKIKYSAIVMSVLYATALPLAYVVAEIDDAPGLIVISTAFACSPLIVATFAAVLQKLVQNALDMKTENDLTV